MKKLVSLGLVTALSVTGLVACGGNETTPKTEETEPTTTVETPQEKIELKLWLDNDSWAEAMEKGIEKALPNIDIIYENVGAVDLRKLYQTLILFMKMLELLMQDLKLN